MESLKFWSKDHGSILKFDGLGQFGIAVRERANLVYEAGIGPQVEDAGDGMTRYTFLQGTPVLEVDLSREILDRMADYCAFRASAFKSSKQTGQDHLVHMLRHNFQQETGQSIEVREDVFCTASPVFVDARMQPHEWIRKTNGQLLKVDAARHGDDHFLPGPTDISWDLAGAIVEWNMDANAAEYFVATFKKRSGVDFSRNLGPFILAYSAFRMGYCRMALSGTQDREEKERFRSAHLRYRKKMVTAATTIATAA